VTLARVQKAIPAGPMTGYTSTVSKAPHTPAEIGVRELRDHLSSYLEEVRAGAELIVTERGTPIARIVPVEGLTRWQGLLAVGAVTPATGSRIRSSDLPDAIAIEGDFAEFLEWSKGGGDEDGGAEGQ